MDPIKIKEPNPEFPNLNIVHEINESLSKGLVLKLESIYINGLKRKGFEFKNELELEEFIKQRCRCEIYEDHYQRIYFVDNEPFLEHRYNPKIDFPINVKDGKTTISASCGSFTYL